jgi:hypothetical protein
MTNNVPDAPVDRPDGDMYVWINGLLSPMRPNRVAENETATVRRGEGVVKEERSDPSVRL